MRVRRELLAADADRYSELTVVLMNEPSQIYNEFIYLGENILGESERMPSLRELIGGIYDRIDSELLDLNQKYDRSWDDDDASTSAEEIAIMVQEYLQEEYNNSGEHEAAQKRNAQLAEEKNELLEAIRDWVPSLPNIKEWYNRVKKAQVWADLKQIWDDLWHTKDTGKLEEPTMTHEFQEYIELPASRKVQSVSNLKSAITQLKGTTNWRGLKNSELNRKGFTMKSLQTAVKSLKSSVHRNLAGRENWEENDYSYLPERVMVLSRPLTSDETEKLRRALRLRAVNMPNSRLTPQQVEDKELLDAGYEGGSKPEYISLYYAGDGRWSAAVGIGKHTDEVIDRVNNVLGMVTGAKKAALGTPGDSISHGTLREEDLIEAFMGELERLDPQAYQAALEEQSSFETMDDMSQEEFDGWFLNEYLFDVLQNYAPPGHYFGAHPGDGSDFGFWPAEDFDEDEDQIRNGMRSSKR